MHSLLHVLFLHCVLHCLLCIVHCVLCFVFCVLCIVHCDLCNVYCMLYVVYGTLCSVYCTLYINKFGIKIFAYNYKSIIFKRCFLKGKNIGISAARGRFHNTFMALCIVFKAVILLIPNQLHLRVVRCCFLLYVVCCVLRCVHCALCVVCCALSIVYCLLCIMIVHGVLCIALCVFAHLVFCIVYCVLRCVY